MESSWQLSNTQVHVPQVSQYSNWLGRSILKFSGSHRARLKTTQRHSGWTATEARPTRTTRTRANQQQRWKVAKNHLKILPTGHRQIPVIKCPQSTLNKPGAQSSQAFFVQVMLAILFQEALPNFRLCSSFALAGLRHALALKEATVECNIRSLVCNKLLCNRHSLGDSRKFRHKWKPDRALICNYEQKLNNNFDGGARRQLSGMSLISYL